MDAKVKCKCGHENNINPTNIKKQELYIGNEKLTITHCECEGCKQPMTLQIDNAETLMMLNNEFRMLRKASETKKPKDIMKMQKTDKVLTDKRNELLRKYEGRFTYVGLKKFEIKCAMLVPR